jgi:hypothetical protein
MTMSAKCQKRTLPVYSITSSARASSSGGGEARGGGRWGPLGICRNDWELISSIQFTDSPLDCVMRWTAVPSTPSYADRTLVGYTVSTLHRPTGRAVIPRPSVTVAVVRWWVIIAVVWRPWVIILRLGRHECAKRDCANAASGQEYPPYTHCVALIFSSERHCLSLSWPQQLQPQRFGWSERPQMVRGCLIGRTGRMGGIPHVAR